MNSSLIFAIGIFLLMELPAEALTLRKSASVSSPALGNGFPPIGGFGIARNSSTGDIYVAGTISQNGSGADIFVGRFNSSLALISSVTINGADNRDDQAYDVAVDGSGNVYVAGSVAKTFLYAEDFALFKFNPALNLISSVTITGPIANGYHLTQPHGIDHARAIAISGSNIYAAGFMTLGTSASARPQIYLAKFTTALAVVKSAVVESGEIIESKAFGLAASAGGEIYLTGYTSTSSYRYDFYLAKYDSNLIPKASLTIHQGEYDIGHSIALGASGKIYVAGAITTNYLNRDFFVGSFNSALTMLSSRTFNGTDKYSTDEARGIGLDAAENIIAAGDLGNWSNGAKDLFMAKLDSSLMTISSITYSDSSYSYGLHDLVPGNSGQYFATGYQGSSRIFLAQLADDTSVPSLFVDSATTNSIQWGWVDVSTETGYRIAMATSPETYVSAPIAANTTSYLETGLSTNTSYSRVAIAIYDKSNSTSPSVSGYTLAASPSNLSITQAFISSMTVSWAANGNPEGTQYKLGYWLTGNSTASVTTTGLSYTLTKLGGSNTYYIQVSGQNGEGIETTPSNTVSTVTLTAPATISEITAGSGAILTYNPSPGEISVEIPATTYTQNVTFTVETPAFIPQTTSPIADLKATGVAVSITPNQNLTAASDITVTISYRDSDVSGLDEKRLICAKYDESRSYWIPILDSTSDPANNKVSCRTRTFSTFQVMEAASQADFSSVKIFPNPFIPSLGHTKVNFSNLPADSTIAVHTLTGDKIADFGAASSGLATWDGKTTDGRGPASGIYLILIRSGNSSKVFKLGIER